MKIGEAYGEVDAVRNAAGDQFRFDLRPKKMSPFVVWPLEADFAHMLSEGRDWIPCVQCRKVEDEFIAAVVEREAFLADLLACHE